MTKKIRFLVSVIFLGALFFPQTSWAGCYTACDYGEVDASAGACNTDHDTLIRYDGLVPCGKKVHYDALADCSGGTPSNNDLPCQLCHFVIMLDAILDFVIGPTGVAFIIAILMIVFSGLLFIIGEVFAGTVSPGLINTAKSILKSVLISLVILFAAWIVVNTIFMFLGVADWTKSFTGPGNWFIIRCPIELPEGFGGGGPVH